MTENYNFWREDMTKESATKLRDAVKQWANHLDVLHEDKLDNNVARNPGYVCSNKPNLRPN